MSRGDRLACRDGACLKFWTVIEGSAATCTTFRDGRRQILAIEDVGDTVCGLMAADGTEQTLEALTDCCVCEADLSNWMCELRDSPDFLKMSFRLMHRRLVKSMAHAAMLGRLDSYERVTYFLADRASQSQYPDGLITLNMSREDIADYLGLNTDSVSRILGKIRKSGLFRFLSPTEYTVPDFAAVARRLPVAFPKPVTSIAQRGGLTP